MLITPQSTPITPDEIPTFVSDNHHFAGCEVNSKAAKITQYCDYIAQVYQGENHPSLDLQCRSHDMVTFLGALLYSACQIALSGWFGEMF